MEDSFDVDYLGPSTHDQPPPSHPLNNNVRTCLGTWFGQWLWWPEDAWSTSTFSPIIDDLGIGIIWEFVTEFDQCLDGYYLYQFPCISIALVYDNEVARISNLLFPNTK
jgi:hypothetical protein